MKNKLRKRHRQKLTGDQFQQRKRAEELTDGMALPRTCNADIAELEQLAHKIKEEKIITTIHKLQASLHKLQAPKRRRGLSNVLNNYQYPSRTLCLISIPHVLCAIMYPSHSKRPRPSKWKSKRIVKFTTAIQNSCAL